MTAILGLNAFHPDAAACLVVDGRLVAAVAEERLGERQKHFSGFPSRAVEQVLKIGGLQITEIEHVAVGYNPNANLKAKVAHTLHNPLASRGVIANYAAKRVKSKSLADYLSEACGVPKSRFRFQLHRVEHHLAHVASSFFASPFERAAAFTYDGSGDFVSGLFARCQGNEIEILHRVHVPHSLGFFYTALCQLIGFEKFGEEYKVMGLAAYGEPAYLERMEELLTCRAPDYTLAQRFFNPFGSKAFTQAISGGGPISIPPLFSEEMEAVFGSRRRPGEEITQRDKDLACSAQKHFEHAVIQCLQWLHRQVPVENLVTAGGCALNGVCNARILRDTPFTRAYIQCAASDDGTAVGAALHVWNGVLKQERMPAIERVYLGAEYPVTRIRSALGERGLPYEELDRPELLERTAGLLGQGAVIGWYQGRSEWGPRALGNRSILAHPGWPGMKDLINRKIKRRESFRPFAPSILAHEVPNYFEQDVRSPFMMHVVKIKPGKRAELASVCHEDDTGRLHSVTREQNDIYFDLIEAFGQRTGTPVVLNTSFNENEPIVDTPEQAIDCFMRNDLDALVLGPALVKKPGPAET